MKIAIIGQSAFAASVYTLLKKDGHTIVGVYTVPDANNREDALATVAKEDNVKVFKLSRWRVKGKPIPEILDQYKQLGAELNVLPYCSQFIPMEVIEFPKHQSIIYHPSLLPRHRGASSINWTLIHGDTKTGFTVFWADDGLDEGPILLQRECPVDPDDTVESLYNKYLYPQGVIGVRDAVRLIANGTAPRIIQPTEGASYEPLLNKKELTMINFKSSAQQIHNFIRGMDKVPGATAIINGETVKLFSSSLYPGPIPYGKEVTVDGMVKPAIISYEGLILFGIDGGKVLARKIQLPSGKMISASKFGKEDVTSDVTLTEVEADQIENVIKKIWNSILLIPIESSTDFFKSGAGSMDVTRMIEEVKDATNIIDLTTEDSYMAPVLDDFVKIAVLKSRGVSLEPDLVYDEVTVKVSDKKSVTFPRQLFVNNEFVNSPSGLKLPIYNPHDESLITKVECADAEDVDRAVYAAQVAFQFGEWSKMSARDRGRILMKLADLMEQHKEELAIIESIDSGAVYTLAIKTHIGMSIETFRYFAGWCDKIEGSTIPISHARPNKNLTLTKREPIGVCGLITPWNYPLMMVAWKSAACLAAGNTLVLKPAQVCPLTALKLAELTVKAGFPPGVFNVLPGTGRECGQAIVEHPLVRKLGFTGSTPVGKQIMKSCAESNLKKVSLELGGKSPLIIFKDTDLDLAVRQAMGAVFFNKGENCIAAGRIFVEEAIHDEFIEKVARETAKIKIGNPLDRSTSHGPQNHRAHLEKLLDYIKKGSEEGAKLVYGGKQVVDLPGLYLQPTIFTNVTDDMYIAQEESFGPIMIISTFTNGDVNGVIKRANATEYGLASGVFTQDIKKALQVADSLQAGTCFINCYNKTDVAAPFGGHKQSGFGKDLGKDALNEYLVTKTVTIEY